MGVTGAEAWAHACRRRSRRRVAVCCIIYTPATLNKGLCSARALWCGMYCEVCAFRGRARCRQA
eukprot:scaffold1957_cov110-Isochrysis_galbana.AAC.16